jgi:hypothetical protein
MSNRKSFRRVLAGVAFATALALLPSCGSNDGRSLVLVDVPVAGFANPENHIDVKVRVGDSPVAEQTYPLGSGTTTHLGIYLPSGTDGDVTVVASIVDGNGCAVAAGTSPAAVKAGETSKVVTITLVATNACGPFLDGGVPAPSDGGVDQAVVDAGSRDADAPSVSADVPPVVSEAGSASPDATPEAAPDVAGPVVDAPMDLPMPVEVAGPGPDLGPDSAADAPTTMNILGNCTKYTHSKLGSDGGAQDWGIRRLAFSPDGKYLVSFGEDGRAKVWNVTATGLTDTGVLFSGANSLYGAISTDGKYVAVGDSESQVKVYDLAASIQFGTPSVKWTLPPDTLSPRPYNAFRLQFTSDGAHLIVVYGGNMNPDPNQFVVWDLATQLVVRTIKFGYHDIPMAIFPGDYAGAMWVASSATTSPDAGGYLSTVTLMDVSQTTPAKAQATLAGDVNAMALSPDGTTLAMAFDSSEVSLWDITSKANIAKLGSPLVVGSSSSTMSAYSLAYTPDGKYLAAGLGDFYGESSVNLTLLQQRTSLQKTVDSLPWSMAFAPDGLALAIGERDYGILLYCRT